MGSRKASLLLCILFFLHLQHYFFQAISRPTPSLASPDPSHGNLPVQSVELKHDGDAFSDKTEELAVVVKMGVGGGGGHSFGGGGRSFGGGGRSYGGGGSGERSMGGGGGGVRGVGGGGGGGHRSSGDRKSASVWLSLSTLLGLVLYF
ncbi:unnamed protein product [Eruca vesicaria subsp. sativa]|uniref:Glycine-rich protein n=1 Tax=Eruca vesicaria subsp. sativa TaxID=29727 RepID=A0ABC8J1M0_ERUVS|nr:unnamed protein product [Eruca vesicaria subsp. sativa]